MQADEGAQEHQLHIFQYIFILLFSILKFKTRGTNPITLYCYIEKEIHIAINMFLTHNLKKSISFFVV